MSRLIGKSRIKAGERERGREKEGEYSGIFIVILDLAAVVGRFVRGVFAEVVVGVDTVAAGGAGGFVRFVVKGDAGEGGVVEGAGGVVEGVEAVKFGGIVAGVVLMLGCLVCLG